MELAVDAMNATVVSSLAPATTCFGLFGNDWILNSQGNLQLCEINSHPALGWGTMAQVDDTVYDDLVLQTLTILLDGHQESSSFVYLC